MTSLRIENLGPIVDSSTINLTPITLLMGPQSAGKSTFMKVFCYCRWIEKCIMVSSSENLVKQYTHYGRFIRELKQYHRLNDDFFSKETRITFESDVLSIIYAGEKNPRISRKKSFQKERYNTKLSYIPAERNLISAFKNIDRAYRSSERDALFNFIYEWDEARSHFTQDNPYSLSVPGGFRYCNVGSDDIVLMADGKRIPSFYASSGLQSVIPLEVMSRHFLSLVGKMTEFSKHDLSSYIWEVLNSEGQNESIKLLTEENSDALRRRLIYQSSQLFIEEPEQNLYPESQRLLLMSLIRDLKKAQDVGARNSSIFITTHSPYILSVINVLFKAAAVSKRNSNISEIIDGGLILSPDSYSAYYLSNGRFENVLDEEVPMFSGAELDGVSDWVEETISKINNLVYGSEE